MSRAPGKLVVHHRSSNVAMGTVDGFFLMRCFGTITPEDIKATVKCVPILRAARPEGSASIVAIEPTSGFPSEEVRRVAVNVSRETSSHTLALAIVVLGDGFWASAIRGVVTTLNSLTKSSNPRKVTRYEHEAVEWAISTLGESSQQYQGLLLSALEQLKPAASAPPPPSTVPPSTPKNAGVTSKVPPSSKRRAG
jgi:hypothetical protein